MIILIDNYDSFTYNLYQYIGEIDNNIEVYRNDIITNAKIKELNPTHIVISPGPGHPADAGNCIEIIKDNHREVGENQEYMKTIGKMHETIKKKNMWMYIQTYIHTYV